MNVLYIQYADPALYPPVERSAAIFRARGDTVLFLGVAAQGQAAGVVPHNTPRPDVELLEHRIGGLGTLLSYLNFWWRALARTRRERPDIVYCSDLLACPAGLLISWLSSAKVVLHEHDPPSQTRPGFGQFLRWTRKRLARRAIACVLPQTERADRFEAETGRTPLVVFNCPSRAEIGEISPKTASSDRFALWHHGSLGPQRLPFSLLDALSHLPEHVHLEFAGYETERSKGFAQRYLSYARQLDIAPTRALSRPAAAFRAFRTRQTRPSRRGHLHE